MVDLRLPPFSLDADAIEWVRDTIESMSLNERIGQLFLNHSHQYDPAYLDQVTAMGVGGIRYRPGSARDVQTHIRYTQARSRVPLLVASNPETGGIGSSTSGTLVSTHLQAGTAPTADAARAMGRITGRFSLSRERLRHSTDLPIRGRCRSRTTPASPIPATPPLRHAEGPEQLRPRPETLPPEVFRKERFP